MNKCDSALKTQNAFILQLIKEKADLQEALNEEKKKSDEKTILLSKIESENKNLLIKSDQCSNYHNETCKLFNEISGLQEKITLIEGFRQDSIKKYEDSLIKLQNQDLFAESSQQELANENLNLLEQLGILTKENQELKQQNTEFLSIINGLQSENISLVSKLRIFQKFEAQNDTFQSFNPEKSSKTESFSNLSLIQSEISSLSSQLSHLLEKNKVFQKEIEGLKDQIKTQDDIINLINITSMSNNTQKVFGLNDRNLLEDLQVFSNELKEMKSRSWFFELKGSKQTEKIISQSLGSSFKLLTFHRLMQKIVHLLYDKNCEIYLLRNLALDAQIERKVYIPAKNDPVDVIMSEIINNHDPPIQIPIVREDQGVYLIASRTIKVKIENNRMIVRLGGGFESFEDFLSANIQTEIEKLEERRKFGAADSLKVFIDQDKSLLSIGPDSPKSLLFDSSLPGSSNSSFLQNPSTIKKKRNSINKEVIRSFQRKKTIN